MSHNIREFKREFLEHLEIEKGRSMKTVANYNRYLERFLSYAAIETVEEINERLVREYRLWLNRQAVRRRDGTHTLKKRTQNYHLIALRMFLKYAARRKIATLTPDVIDLAKVPERSIDLIDEDELWRLMAAPKGDDIQSLRDKAILELLFSTGLRVSELCSLSRYIDLSKDELSVRGKGEKVRVVFITETAREAIRRYLDKRTDIDDALFINVSPANKGKETRRLTPRSVERIVQKYAIQAGITKKVTPHIIRHSFATDLLRNGADMRSVQTLLGHANITTTQVYTHITDTHLKEIHKMFHGKHRKKR